MQRLFLVQTVAALAASSLGCGEARNLASDPRETVAWRQQVSPLLAAHCSSCHSGAQPAGNYVTTDYAGVLGGGADATPNAIAGDASSRLLQVLAAPAAGSPHAGLEGDLAVLQPWVVKYELAYSQSWVHPHGIMDPSSPGFHGATVRAAGFDLAGCKQCHGADLSGGSAGQSCLGCHDRGPSDCAKCHTAVLSAEPHRTHVFGAGLGQKYACDECHASPKSFGDPSHFPTAGTSPTVSIAFAGDKLSGHRPGATWDPQTRSCRNVYCHSVDGNDNAALVTAPTWTETSRIQCGSCHGLPPADGLHVPGTLVKECSRCHPSAIDHNGTFVVQPTDGGGSTKHLNGVVDVP
jgi:predicted CxxxxCH...CXXCH cytochrome family protein